MNSVAAINVLPSNKEEARTLIVSASADSTVRIWDRKGPAGGITANIIIMSQTQAGYKKDSEFYMVYTC